MQINILAVGDVCGQSGMDFLAARLPALKQELDIAFTVVNGENTNVVGVTPKQADRLLAAGADVVTLGNHTWTRWELQPYLDETVRVLRPANYAPQCPGRGLGIYETDFGKVAVLNLLGRFALDSNTDNPFVAADALVAEAARETSIILVDFHAEATSEKCAMAYYLDGRAGVLFGTHTHVQTADERIFPGGLGFITDLGMTGASDSVIGVKWEQSLAYFRGDMLVRFEESARAPRIQGALFTVGEDGRCTAVERVSVE